MPILRRMLATALVVMLAGPAVAGLEICNGTDARHSVAIGYKDGDNWISRGWWNIDPGECTTPIGDDLRNRYYYFRAEAAGYDFDDENYAFCTDPSAFRIIGDEDCKARGYSREMFRRIDTGPKAKSFSVTFHADHASPAPAPERAHDPAGPSDPGTWGEPYFSATALFQDCVSETEAPFCTFHADGTKFYVYRDGRTPDYIFSVLEGFWPGTPIEVAGDLEAIHDRTADIVLRSATPREWNRWDSILDQLQGSWYSTLDPNSQFNIIGSELENTYDGAWTGLEYLSLTGYCDHFEGGEYLMRMDEESGDVQCYSIEDLEPFRMVLMYLPRANFHEFRKLD